MTTRTALAEATEKIHTNPSGENEKIVNKFNNLKSEEELTLDLHFYNR